MAVELYILTEIGGTHLIKVCQKVLDNHQIIWYNPTIPNKGDKNMIVLEHGENYHKAQCSFCKCKFGYLDKDVQCGGVSNFDNSLVGYLVCPECAETIYVWGSLKYFDKVVYKLPKHVSEHDGIMLRCGLSSPY